MAGKHISLLVHFIWSTAAREPWISDELQDRLYGYIGGVLRAKNVKLIMAGGVADHIHLYASLPSTISLAEVVNVAKSNSSRWVHKNFPTRRGFAWQEGYGAFSVSKSAEPQLMAYIRSQVAHHRRRSFKEEFLEFLEKYEIEYDERYLWD